MPDNLLIEIITVIALVSGLIMGVCMYLDKMIEDDVKWKFAKWLHNISSKEEKADATVFFVKLFDRVFGRKHFSLRCFLVSCLCSLCAVVFFWVLLYITAPERATFTAGLGGNLFTIVMIAGLLNMLPDYLSLLETRWMLGWMSRLDTLLGKLTLLLLDLLVTGVIFFLFLLAAGYLLDYYDRDYPPFIEILLSLGLVYDDVSVARMLQLFMQMFSQSSSASEYSVFLYSTFLTSIWLWLFILGSYSVKTYQGLGLLVSHIIKLEKYPFATVGGALVVLLTPVVVLSMVFGAGHQTVTNGQANDLEFACHKKDCFNDRLQNGSQAPTMVKIPAGSFWMGSAEDEFRRVSDEGPRHKRTILAFALGVNEVTVGQYREFIEDNGSKGKGGCWVWRNGQAQKDENISWRDPGFKYKQTEDHPVTCVSWEDAQQYISWLSRQTGEEYRLPSEAEWEYATRAGTTTAFNTGGCITTDQANYDGNYGYGDCPASGVIIRGTRPVGSYRYAANSFGLYDVHGNVWEWVEDCWNENYEGAPNDGTAWLSGKCALRVLRGGSWFNLPRWLRSAFRYRNHRALRFFNVGFRLARTLKD